MIDWAGVAVNSLWVVGLAIVLAALSFARWVARQEKRKLWGVLDQPGYTLAISLCFGLFAVSLALSSERWWERVLWALLLAAFIIQAAWSLQRKGRTDHGEVPKAASKAE